MPSFDRRSFLKSVGLGAAALPLLSVELTRADAGRQRKRLITIAVPNGVRQCVYLPDGTDRSSRAKAGSPLEAMLPHWNDMSFVSGLKLQNGWDTIGGGLGGHASSPFVFTGSRGVDGPETCDSVFKTAGGPSIDQHIAVQIDLARERAGEEPMFFRSLALNPLRVSEVHSIISWNGAPLIPGTPNSTPVRTDPRAIFDELAGGTAAQQRTQRVSTMDFLHDRLRRFRSQIGTEDRARIDQHHDALRTIERRLDGARMCLGERPVAPVEDWCNFRANPHIPSIIRSQIDLTVSAFACDVTRVASMSWSNSHNLAWVFSWLDVPGIVDETDYFNSDELNGNRRNHHEIAHKSGGDEAGGDPFFNAMSDAVNRWFLEQVAYLVQRMKDTPDPAGGSVFDSSVIVFANMQRTGGGHQTDDLPWLVVGSAGGALSTGRYLRWPSGTDGQNVAQNRLFATLCRAFGVPANERNEDWFAHAEYGSSLDTLLT